MISQGLLYTDGSGDETATWTVDVTYDGYTDSDFVIYGEITISNPNDNAVTIDSVVDDLGLTGYEDIDLACEDEDETCRPDWVFARLARDHHLHLQRKLR